MKRIIAFLLGAALTFNTTVFASSRNEVDRSNITTKTEINNTEYDVSEVLYNGQPIGIQIVPNDEIESGDSIILSIDNAEFNRDLVNDSRYQWTSSKGDWDDVQAAISGKTTAQEIADVIGSFVKAEGSSELPYKVSFIDENSIQVFLAPLRDIDAENSDNDVAANRAKYRIKLPIDVQDSTEGDVTITIDSNMTMVSENSVKIATVVDDSGSTTASIIKSDIKVTSSDRLSVPKITVKEDVANTFKGGEKISLRVNGNYKIADKGYVIGGQNADTLLSKSEVTLKSDERTIEFIIPNSFNTTSSKLRAINFMDIVVEAEDEDQYGDINFTISGGNGITRETLNVGERADYGFALTALDEIPTIYAGRSPYRDSDLDEDDFATAEIEFAETSPDTWLQNRRLEFHVPEGIKIIGYEITKTKYFKDDKGLYEASITDDGTTLKFNSDIALNTDECSYFDMKLYITASPDFKGDVTIEVEGAGLDKNNLESSTIAKVIAPINVTTNSTTAKLGYKAIKTADIVIKENEAGALLDDESVEIKLDDTYADDIVFNDENTDYAVDGELEIDNFKIKNGKITFNIKTTSYNKPSTVTIKNVEIGTTRSIPYGNYSIIVGGKAIVNNYSEDVDSNKTISNVESADMSNIEAALNSNNNSSEYKDMDLFEVEGFEFKDYLTIKTDAETLDSKVEVTIGSNVIKMDDQEIEIDTPAYIQTASNSTMVPLRFVSLAIGIDKDAVDKADETSKITWDANNKVASVIYNNKVIQFQANSNIMNIDGTSIGMENDVKAEIVNGRMFIPFRALGTALGVPVTWNTETKTAIYN